MPDNIISKMNRYYDDRAPWHDSLMSYTDTDTMLSDQKPIIDYIKTYIYKKTVLEIACGTGNWSAVLAKFASFVTAVDYSNNSLSLAKEKFREVENLNFIHSDAYSLNNINEQYDVIFMADFYSHIPNEKIDTFLKNLFKISQKSTIVISLDMTEKEYFKNEKIYFDKYNNRISARRLPNGNTYEIIKNFPSEDSLNQTIHKICQNFHYEEFPELERWLMTFTIPKNSPHP